MAASNDIDDQLNIYRQKHQLKWDKDKMTSKDKNGVNKNSNNFEFKQIESSRRKLPDPYPDREAKKAKIINNRNLSSEEVSSSKITSSSFSESNFENKIKNNEIIFKDKNKINKMTPPSTTKNSFTFNSAVSNQPASTSNSSFRSPSEVFSNLEDGISKTSSAAMSTPKSISREPSFTVMTWNIDGLCEKELPGRILAIIDTIRNEKPAIVMLQEVTDFVLRFLEHYLSSPYSIFIPSKTSNVMFNDSNFINLEKKEFSQIDSSQRMAYYCVTLISKFHFSVLSKSRSSDIEICKNCFCGDTFYFPSSSMGRHLLMVDVLVNPTSLADCNRTLKTTIINTHAESMRDHGTERKNQFDQTLKIISNKRENFIISNDMNSSSLCILFGGDMNARDAEINSFKNEMSSIGLKDAWVHSGSPEGSRFTWDLRKNFNNSTENSSSNGYIPRLRFDRLYFLNCGDSQMDFCSPKLIGTKIIDKSVCNVHPSDHFGLFFEVYKAANN